MKFDENVTLDFLEKLNINISNITLEEFDNLVKRIKNSNKNVDNEKEIIVNWLINDLEELTKFKSNNVFDLKINPFKTEIKSGLINLLSISNKFPYFIEKSFSIKKKETIEDIIIKNNSNDQHLYDYRLYLSIIKMLEHHFKEFKLTKNLDLKETHLNIDVVIPTKDFEKVIIRGRLLTSSISKSLNDLLLEVNILDNEIDR